MNRQKNLLEQAISEYFEDIDPRHNRLSTDEVEKIRNAINKTGEWTQQEEWRISTYTETKVSMEKLTDRTWFKVQVECNMQKFSCLCPSIEKAFMCSKLYQHFIIYQFYSVGPPWAP